MPIIRYGTCWRSSVNRFTVVRNFDEMIDEVVGQKLPVPFEIIKTGENTGILRIILPDGSDDDMMADMMGMISGEYPFAYSDGVLTVENTETRSEEGGSFTIKQKGSFTVKYGPEEKSIILAGEVSTTMGDINIPEEGMVFQGDLVRIKMSFERTRPLPAKDEEQ